MPAKTPRSTLFILALILMLVLSACASDPAEDQIDPDTIDAGPESIESIPEPTEEETPAASYNACEMLTQAEIEAAAFRDFPVGEGRPGTDAPFSRSEAVSCAWEVGNPDAQFHERLYLYIITLNGADPNAVYEDQASRLARAEDRAGIGDRAAYEGRSGFHVVLDGDFLFLLRADLLNLEGIEAGVIELAQLIISRK